MDLHQRTFDYPIQLFKTDGADAGLIGPRRVRLGAAAACAWMVHARRAAA